MIWRGGRGAARWAAGALRCLHYSPNAAAILAIAAPLSTCRVQLLGHWSATAPRTALVAGTALVYQQRLYASTAASGSSGAFHGHDHRFSDSKNGAAGSSGSSSANSGAGGSSSINGYGGGSGFRGSGAAKQQQAGKWIKKVKASRRILKSKRAGPKAKAASTPASSASGSSAATASASAASGGASANQGSGAGRSSSGSGGGIVASLSPGAASAQSRTTACRRKKKSSRVPPPPSGSPPTPGSSAATRGSRRPLTCKRASTGSLSGTGATAKKAVTVAHAASHGRSAVSSPSATAAVRAKAKKRKRIRICVLSSSYDGTDSATASVDNYWCTPQHYMKKDRHKYSFADVSMKKIDSYRTVRKLVTSNKYDVFFNLCDGGRDEKRAGVDVVEALEEQNAAFTGTDSRGFEPSKIDMKLMVGSSGVKVPNFVLLSNDESLAKKCRHLKFPVIVKHLSGYASVGIQKDSRCDTLDQLRTKVRGFIKEYNHALVEEFIRGREGTVLACADPGSPFGVKVFKPLMFNFLQNNDDFAYFEKKWTMECGDQAYGFLASSDPAYTAITDMARNAFKYIMSGVGYGRVDFRIDELTGEPYFLEINPNCGMWYAPKDGGDFADVMVEGDPHWNHERFVANAVARALRDQAARKPWYFISHDRNGQFSTRASKTVAAGKCLFGDAVHPIPVVAKSLYKLGEEEPTVGCVICRGDGIHQAVALRHSCEPNMGFVHGRTLLFAAKRQINVGEELTVDYATLRDESMPHFVCSCGTENCRSVIFPMPAMPRTVEAKTMKRLLREKKQVWMKEKADREAERILKKRSSRAPSSSASGSGGGGASAGSSSSAGHASSSASGGASSSSGSGSSSGISTSEKR
ncbi:ATP-grasp domain/D-ala D-ala ligase C-terminus/SET domain containing protein, putative [Leishmania donovani]|uniref:ATP-grasp domain/D-ala D-ala ligase C-terminus/SET domain containing protein, putative n=2 Tax=Leishmania donovani TaxID=5661 RepID=A0A3S7WZE7_LEIDO|nr:ATP-grasp domain/D-ala D-ala ligase C-terminus/SET domain containing protein, putative [Leishmania donovani]